MISIPLKDGTEYTPDRLFIDELEKAYPGVDIEEQLRVLRMWNVTRPTQRKTKRGINKHINFWMSVEYRKVREKNKPAALAQSHKPYIVNMGETKDRDAALRSLRLALKRRPKAIKEVINDDRNGV